MKSRPSLRARVAPFARRGLFALVLTLAANVTASAQQRRVGAFDYRVMLPSQVDAQGIEATLADGVLTVRVPKMAQDRRKIEVKGS